MTGRTDFTSRITKLFLCLVILFIAICKRGILAILSIKQKPGGFPHKISSQRESLMAYPKHAKMTTIGLLFLFMGLQQAHAQILYQQNFNSYTTRQNAGTTFGTSSGYWSSGEPAPPGAQNAILESTVGSGGSSFALWFVTGNALPVPASGTIFSRTQNNTLVGQRYRFSYQMYIDNGTCNGQTGGGCGAAGQLNVQSSFSTRITGSSNVYNNNDGILPCGTVTTRNTGWVNTNSTSTTFAVDVTGGGSCGNDFWIDNILVECFSPVISSQPVGATYCQNAAATPLSITATDAGTYRWYRNTTNSTSGGTLVQSFTTSTHLSTTNTYTPSTTSTGTFYYYVVINEGTPCSVTSNVITVTVNPQPTLTCYSYNGGSWPVLTSCAATFCAGTTGERLGVTSGYASYTWTKPAGAGGFAAGNEYILNSPLTAADAGTYTVTVTNAQGCSVTRSITLTVNPQPTLTCYSYNGGSWPVLTSCAATFCAGTTGERLGVTSGYASYTWTKPAGAGGFAAGNEYILNSPLTAADAGTYTVTVTNAQGCSVTRSITLTVNPLNTVTGPGSATTCVNTAITNITHTTTGATGIGTPTGLPSGVTASFAGGVITISGTPTTATGSPFNYSIPLTGGCGTVNATGTITVNPAAVAGTASSDQTVCSSVAPATLTLTGYTGTIQWQSSTDNITFTNISGATSATYSPGLLSSTTYYRAVVASAGGCTVTSNTVTITVNSSPATPLVSTTAATCSAAGTATITNVVSGNTYTFTPSGPTVNTTTGAISGMVAGTNYTVTSGNGTCASAASASFSINAVVCNTPPVATGYKGSGLTNPGGTVQINVPSAAFGGWDAEDGVYSNHLMTRKVTLHPAMGGTLYYYGVAITSATVITNFDNALVFIDPDANGLTVVDFDYTVWDNDGLESAPATVILGFGEIILPVTGLSVQVREENCGAVLSWRTLSERGVRYFVVEYSVDGRSWTPAGQVLAKNIATGSSYSYRFGMQRSGTGYYRVQVVDADGSVSYSQVQQFGINCGSTLPALQLQPNPVPGSSGAVWIELSGSYRGSGQLVVQDGSGRVVSSRKVTITQNRQRERLEVIGLSLGVYYVQVLDGSGQSQYGVRKLIVQ